MRLQLRDDAIGGPLGVLQVLWIERFIGVGRPHLVVAHTAEVVPHTCWSHFSGFARSPVTLWRSTAVRFAIAAIRRPISRSDTPRQRSCRSSDLNPERPRSGSRRDSRVLGSGHALLSTVAEQRTLIRPDLSLPLLDIPAPQGAGRFRQSGSQVDRIRV